MAIVKWEPFKELVTRQDRMSQLFDGAFKPSLDEGGTLMDWAPAVDVYEDAEAIQIRAELPGMDMKEIEVKVADNTLQIKGEKKLENADKRENYHRVERVFGRFVRFFTLPNTVAPEKIRAKYENGILNITLPKREETKPKNITVEVH